MILFDNASETDELNTTNAFRFSPKSFVMFGDPFRKPKDGNDLTSKYPNFNLNQSMFQRLFAAERCVFQLQYTHRFSPKVLNVLNNFFYKGTLQTGFVPKVLNSFNGFGLFHRYNDGFMYTFLQRLMEILSPDIYSYGIILPPNIPMQSLDTTLGCVSNIFSKYLFDY